MCDLIRRQDAIDALFKLYEYQRDIDPTEAADLVRQGVYLAEKKIEQLPSAQPEKRTEERTETHACDLIDREAAVDAIYHHLPSVSRMEVRTMLHELPSAQPTLCGYDIEHLMLIANVMRKENLPPERVVEALTDIGRIVSIVKDEFEEALRKAVEQCMT